MADLSLTQIKALYDYLDEHFDALHDACKNDEQRESLARSYEAARDNFHKAENAILKDDDSDVQKLTGEIKVINQTLADMQGSLSKIASTIQLVATGVSLGSKLLAFAIP
jgi:hypothetical protein